MRGTVIKRIRRAMRAKGKKIPVSSLMSSGGTVMWTGHRRVYQELKRRHTRKIVRLHKGAAL